MNIISKSNSHRRRLEMLRGVSVGEGVRLVFDAALDRLRDRLRLPVALQEYRALYRELEPLAYSVWKHGNICQISGPGFGGNPLRCEVRLGGTSDISVFRQVFLDAEYEPFFNMIRQRTDPGTIKNIIDLGANIGLTTIAMKQAFPAARIVAVEPMPDNLALLQRNLSLNQLRGVTSCQAAAWSHPTKLAATDFRDGKEWAFAVKEADGQSARDDQIQAVTVPELMEQNQFATVDVLKIDVEGAEAAIFSSAGRPERFLKHVFFLAMEMHEETGRAAEIRHCLTAQGFVLQESGEMVYGYNRSL